MQKTIEYKITLIFYMDFDGFKSEMIHITSIRNDTYHITLIL